MTPLQGLRILDLSRVLACPFASMILAELGAEVIKVEQPGSGDETRGFEPFATSPGGERVSGYYMACNRAKRSITVDLRQPEGVEIIRALAMRSDALVENFPTGTMQRRGLDWPKLREIAPKLVMLSCTGFGQTGPYARRKGYDTVFQAMGGIMGLTGERGGGPVKPGLPVADLTSGLWVAIALLAALRGRDAAGHGAHVDLSMLDGQVSLLTIAAARFFALGEVPERMGTEHPGRVPTASFLCSDGRFLHITASDQHWAPLCAALGLDSLAADPALASNAGRLAQRERVMAAMTAAMAGMTRAQAVTALDAVDVPNGPVLALDEVLTDPHIQARSAVQSFTDPVLGSFPSLRLPFRFDGFDDPQATRRPPGLGEHTDEILAQIGYDPDRIAALRAKGTV
ncbi:crotonobetainyl-CoA:carnitine CoA-transferase CaiB-like acyl-CoA transferase [Humitalea rosea]|uniref:Crotonobetainyl-CoA:carnitine CoA-transferase CaiB-like acyl-CoA transferase n=1 Tax=Humitalea rosea TaxID=990373 RepID=A0A2W7IMY2_9PROT|nr:CaiB/BaiF CoA-transferase family protein [Humitalea rosea]PZW48671.1 crotonobetainyl-CoA:carnitine CoA-transferase CaiB-like acyl-CoA transferase [Humitalea rosea]